MSLGDIERRLQALEDAEAIKKLHQKYIDLMDNLKYREVLDLFTEDATAEVRNFGVKKGRDEMAQVYLDILAKRRGDMRYEGHFAVHPEIELNGDIATGKWLIYMLFSKPKFFWVQGRNECEYRKVNGEWKISRLKFTRTLASDPAQYP